MTSGKVDSARAALGVEPADLRMALEIGGLASREASALLVRILSRAATDLDEPAPWREADVDDLLKGRGAPTAILGWLKQVRDRAQVLVGFDLHPLFDGLELAAVARLEACAALEAELALGQEAVARLDSRGRLAQVSPGFAALIARDSGALVGLHLAELGADPGEGARILDGLEVARRQGRWRGAGELLGPGGGSLPAELVVERRAEDAMRLWVRVEDRRELRQRQIDLRLQGTRDALTGLAGPAAFQVHLRCALRRHQRTGERVALVMGSVDGLEAVVATLGPSAKAVILHTVGRRFAQSLRDSDEIAHLGLGRFAAVVEYRADPAELAARLGEVHTGVARSIRYGAWTTQVRLSVGVALVPEDGREGPALVEAARHAEERARRCGGGQTCFVRPEVEIQIGERRSLREAALRAIDSGTIGLVLQPQVDLGSGEVVGAECLARWQDPEHGELAPRAFVPLFARLGRGNQLLRRVVEGALQAALALDRVGLGVARVAVNLTLEDLLDEPLAVLVDAADQVGVTLDRLEIEVPASVLQHPRAPELLTRLAQLRRAGVTVCLDDLGLDLSGLAGLPDLPVDALKLDGPHVRALAAGHPRRGAAVDAVLAYARGAGLRLTAEAVEGREALEALVARRCPQAQGYALARPRPLDQILAEGWGLTPPPLAPLN